MAPTTTTLTVFKATPNTQSKDQNSKNKDSNESTSTLRKASVGATTSPGVTQPQATVPSVGAEAENIRPPPSAISADGTNSLNQDRDRDARAYERERQRAKQAGEWAERRARKAGTIGGTGVSRPGVAHAGRRSKSWRGGKMELDLDVYAALPRRRDIELTRAKLWDELLLKGVSLPPSGGGGADASKAAQGVKVNLSELVVISHRRPRKLNGAFPLYLHGKNPPRKADNDCLFFFFLSQWATLK